MRTIASVGASILGSGTSSQRTSRLPCHTSAFIRPPPGARRFSDQQFPCPAKRWHGYCSSSLKRDERSANEKETCESAPRAVDESRGARRRAGCAARVLGDEAAAPRASCQG